MVRIDLFSNYRLKSLIAILGVALIGVSCYSVSTPVNAPDVTEFPLPPPVIEEYRLQIGDTISVAFWGNPELDQELVIRPDGRISLPFVDEVQASNLTPRELDDDLTRRYENELATPDITVVVRAVRTYLVWVGGEVTVQGTIEMHQGLTLMQALTEAGGLLHTSREKDILLIRKEPDGVVLARKIDIRPVQSGTDPSADIPLQTNDIIFVPRTKIQNIALTTDYIYRIIPIQIRVQLFNGAIFTSD